MRPWFWGNPLSAERSCTEPLPMVTSTSSPRAEMAFLRHVSPAQVLVLKNSAFDLMTRSVFIARSPADRTDPQAVQMPEGLGNSPGHRHPPSDRRRQLPRLSGRVTRSVQFRASLHQAFTGRANGGRPRPSRLPCCLLCQVLASIRLRYAYGPRSGVRHVQGETPQPQDRHSIETLLRSAVTF